ncbi:cellulose binding domain-containing protein [Micromonospora sp. WMMA1923]|uniref:cellulose binding domain-containing protein n=1 Tax=Micromonospora sp. WMMA1923 TaxID=3404125 RepID=UPI003B92E457
MLRTFGTILATATLALTGWAGSAGAAGAPGSNGAPGSIGAPGSAGAAATTPAPTPTPTFACPPALPISGQVTGATTTSLTISYSMLLSPPCGYDPPMRVTLFASQADAQQKQNPVASAVTGPQRYGTVTVTGLTPDTEYWFRFSDAAGTWDPYLIGGPARTLGQAQVQCAAAITVDSSWAGGFMATVTVRNPGDRPLHSWRVGWRWSAGERIQTLWGGVAEGTGDTVSVRNATYNATLLPGGSTTFGMIVAAAAVPASITTTCSQ